MTEIAGRISKPCAGLVCHIGAVTGRGCGGNDPCPLTTLAERRIIAFPIAPMPPLVAFDYCVCGQCAKPCLRIINVIPDTA